MSGTYTYGLIGLTEENVGIDRRFYTGLTNAANNPPTLAVSYNAGRVDVFLNGIKLVGDHSGNSNYDYTMDSKTGQGSTVTLTTGVAFVASDVVECVGYVSNSSNTITSYNPTPTSGDGGFNEFRNITQATSSLVNVFLNGVLLDDSDYTLDPSTNGGTVTIGGATLTASDVVVIQVIGALDNSNFVPAGGGTFTGNITIPTGTASGHAVTKAQLDASGVSGITSSADGTAISIDSSEVVTVENKIKVDDIEEKTSAHGVEIDGVTLKDSEITANSIRPVGGQNVVLKQDGGNTALTIDANGNVEVVNHIEQSDGKYVQTDEIRARDGDGLKLRDSGGTDGIFIENGGFVGIGTDNPNNQLGVEGNSNYLLNLKQTGSVIHMLALRGPSSASIDFACDGANNKVKMISLGSGHAIEFVTEDSTTKLTIASNGSIGAPSGTNIYNASDLRLKKNINNLTGSLEKINQMQGVSFEWIDGFCPEETGKIHYGLIAQDLTKIDSNLISEFGQPIEARDAVLDDKGNIIKEAIEASPNKITAGDQVIENPLRVEEKFIIPLLIEAVKTLSEKVSALENA